MGKFVPVFLAFLLNCLGIYVFREPKIPGCGPLLSGLIFLLAVFILLWDVRLYPSSLRKLSPIAQQFIEFITSVFLFEHIVSDFWLPLEAALLTLLPKLAEYEEDLVRQGGWSCEGVCQFLRWEGTGVAASYVLSSYFLLSVMHATRVIDFRLFRCGARVFFKDAMHRLKKLIRHFLQAFGIARKKKVRFCRKTKRSQEKRCPRRGVCDNYRFLESEDDQNYDEKLGCCNLDNCNLEDYK